MDTAPGHGLGSNSAGLAAPSPNLHASPDWMGLVHATCSLPTHTHTTSPRGWAPCATNHGPSFLGYPCANPQGQLAAGPSRVLPLAQKLNPATAEASSLTHVACSPPLTPLGRDFFYSTHPVPSLTHGTKPKIILGLYFRSNNIMLILFCFYNRPCMARFIELIKSDLQSINLIMNPKFLTRRSLLDINDSIIYLYTLNSHILS